MYAVFEKALYDSRRTILWLCVGLSLYALLIVSVFPSIVDQGEELNELVESYPESIMGLVGAESGAFDLADPVQFLNMEFMTWAVLILGAMAMMQAFNAVTNAERSGRMDVMMALPVTRRQMLAGRFLNTLVMLLVVLTVIFFVLLLSTVLWPEFDIPAGDLLAIVYGSLIILLPYTTFVYALVALVPSSKKWAGALAYALFFGMYLVHSLAGASDVLKDIRPFLLFDYYQATEIARDGFEAVNVLLMLGLTLLFGALAWWRIEEKELGV